MRSNESLLIFFAGLATGAALMYFLDSDRGRRRRALVRDQAVGLSNDVREAISDRTQDLSNRAYGLMAEATKAVTGKPIDEIGNTETKAATNQS